MSLRFIRYGFELEDDTGSTRMTLKVNRDLSTTAFYFLHSSLLTVLLLHAGKAF